MKEVALILFLVTYVALLLFPKIRSYIAGGMAVIFVILGIVDFFEVWTLAINWNVILMIAGTMIVVSLFIESKMPALLADLIIEKAPNVKWAVIMLAVFAGLISAFVDNVATVLIVAPIALTISKRINVSPVAPIIAIAVSANIQGFATLVGDTTSIMLGGIAGMNFTDFFWLQGKPGPFFAVQLGALMTVFVMMFIFRKMKQPVSVTERAQVNDYVPTVMLLGIIALLVVASFIPNKPDITNGLITMGMGLVAIVYKAFKTKSLKATMAVVKEIDFHTLGLLAGLFVLIYGITQVGIIDDIAAFFLNVSGNNVFLIYTLVVFVSVGLSAFIDNIPYVATMLPVMLTVSTAMGINPLLLYFGLLCGATLGGNLTPIGASANIAGIGILRKNGHEVKVVDFLKIGVPMTLAAVLSGYGLLWLLWS
ncbi:MAG: SLC13 family permease [Bacilli bacterium]|jgi:Na+/H+ antiporter NhaD/arsenite permease-like protein